MRKILLSVKRPKWAKKKKLNKTICVVGTTSKAGVTHLCLSLANFLRSVIRQEVIYIELKEESSLLPLVGTKQIKVGETIGYKYKGVTYVFTNDVEKVEALMSTEDSTVIVDMNRLNKKNKKIFTNSDSKVVIGSLSPWCEQEYYEFVDYTLLKNKIHIDQVTFCGNNIIRNEAVENFKKLYGSNLLNMPIIEDPFSLKEENFEELLKVLM